MSVSRPARCLLSQSSIPNIRPTPCRSFHTSPKLTQRSRPRFASVKAEDMGLVDRQPAKEVFKPYTEQDQAWLKKMYTPAQIRAIEAGEAHIKPEDLDRQGVVRTDIGTLEYFDDFSQYRTVLDSKPARETPNHPKARMATSDEFEMAFIKWLDKVKALEPPGLTRKDPNYAQKARPNREDFMRFTEEVNALVGPNGLEDVLPLSQFVPSPQPTEEEALALKKEETTYQETEEQNDPRDPTGMYTLLRKQTGMELDDILELKTKLLVRNYVTNQTRLGKIQSTYCLAIAGNGKGRLGIGQAKGQGDNITELATIAAIKNIRPIPLYEDRTIFGEVSAKVSSSTVTLSSRPPGFGLRCQGLIFEMARAAGIQDLAARVPRSRNKMNTVKATYKALMSQRLPDDVARGRGKKMIDVRKVYYGGRL